MQHGTPLDLAKIDVEYSRPMSEALKGATKAILTATGQLIAPDGTETTLQELYDKSCKDGHVIVVDSFEPLVNVSCHVEKATPTFKKVEDFEDGYYWWNDGKNTKWKLAHVQASPFLAKFIGGAPISQSPWGNWKPAEVSQP